MWQLRPEMLDLLCKAGTEKLRLFYFDAICERDFKYAEGVTESPDYELCQLAEQKPGILDELAAERAKQLEVENVELEKQAERLAKEIKRLEKT